jgi:hypothetical protein
LSINWGANCGIGVLYLVCWNRIMSTPPQAPPDKPQSLLARRRAARLEAALRENLKKRKDQSRSRRAGGEDKGEASDA